MSTEARTTGEHHRTGFASEQFQESERRYVQDAKGNTLIQNTWLLPEATIFNSEEDNVRSLNGIRTLARRKFGWSGKNGEVELLQELPDAAIPDDVHPDGVKTYVYYDYDGKDVSATRVLVRDGVAGWAVASDMQEAKKYRIGGPGHSKIYARVSRPDHVHFRQGSFPDSRNQGINGAMDLCRSVAAEHRNIEKRKKATAKAELGKKGVRHAIASRLRLNRS
jgi:hypothetical protein